MYGRRPGVSALVRVLSPLPVMTHEYIAALAQLRRLESMIVHDIVGEYREQRVRVARSEHEPGDCCEAVHNWVFGSFPGEKAPFLQLLVSDQ